MSNSPSHPATPPTDTPELERLLDAYRDAVQDIEIVTSNDTEEGFEGFVRARAAARSAITDFVASLRAEVALLKETALTEEEAGFILFDYSIDPPADLSPKILAKLRLSSTPRN